MNVAFPLLLTAIACGSLASAFVVTTSHTPGLGSSSSSSSSDRRTRLALAATTKTGLTLYGSQGSRSPLVNWGAHEVGVPITMAPSLQENPHPFKQIPCLVDDEDVLVFESGAILQYIYSQSSASKTDSPQRQAAITSWISWANASLDPICFLETPEGKVYDTGLKAPQRRIETLDAVFSTQDFLLTDGFSLADVAVASYLLYVPQFFPDVNLSRWPHLVTYLSRCAGRDGYSAAFGPQVQTMLLGKLAQMKGGGNDASDAKKKLFGMF